MFFVSIILIVVINAKANGNINNDIIYPPHWDQAPSSLEDFPLVNDSSSQYRLIDPWNYIHRLGLYKILISITTPMMPFSASSNASNILFALPAQFGWLFRSNRLFTNNTMNISTNSWWGSANYYLSVVPFLVAMDLGLIKEEPFRIVRQENFCTNFSECLEQIPDAIMGWHKFFVHIKESTSCIENENIDNRIIDKCYLVFMWAAYKSSIYNSLPLVRSKLNHLPTSVEKSFGLSWAKLINLISMTRKNTNLYETMTNQRKFLPFRMLLESDRTADAKDLPDSVNRSLKVLFSFRFDWLSFIEKVWGRITCNYEGRVYAQRTLDIMGESRIRALRYLAIATTNALTHKCDSS